MEPSDCPAGFYCAANNSSPEPCSIGTYSTSLSLAEESECLLCAPGRYCATVGLTEPTGECLAGYFCEAGANASHAVVDRETPSGRHIVGLCPAGYYCLIGSAEPLVCPAGTYCSGGNTMPAACEAGTYQNEAAQASCKSCPAGFICSPAGTIDYAAGTYYVIAGLHRCADTSSEIWLGQGRDNVCPPGHFCPEGLTNLEDGRCPRGTYSNYTGLSNVSQCLGCPAGQYCDELAATAPGGGCAAGYYCTGGAADAQASKCDARSVICDSPSCEGLHAATAGDSCGGQCVSGNFCLQGSRNMSRCTAGFYCGEDAIENVSGPCHAGYYCGAGSATSQQELCPQGFYCPEGTAVPRSCPRGTSSVGKGMASQDDCIKCEAGFYCPLSMGGASGLGNKLPCEAGYYCPAGSTDLSQLCPRGHLCVEQTSQPAPCVMGEYQDEVGKDQCKPCFAGAFCPGVEMFDDEAGYFRYHLFRECLFRVATDS